MSTLFNMSPWRIFTRYTYILIQHMKQKCAKNVMNYIFYARRIKRRIFSSPRITRWEGPFYPCHKCYVSLEGCFTSLIYCWERKFCAGRFGMKKVHNIYYEIICNHDYFFGILLDIHIIQYHKVCQTNI